MPGFSLAIGTILGRLSSLAINFLTPFFFFSAFCNKLTTSLVSWVFVVANSVMDEVRVELVFTNSSNVVFRVVAAVARLSKQPSNSSILKKVPLPPGFGATPARASSKALPNCSCLPAAWRFTLDCFSAFLYISFYLPHVCADLHRSSYFSFIVGNLWVASIAFMAIMTSVASVIGMPALAACCCAYLSAQMYWAIESCYVCMTRILSWRSKMSIAFLTT